MPYNLSPPIIDKNYEKVHIYKRAKLIFNIQILIHGKPVTQLHCKETPDKESLVK